VIRDAGDSRVQCNGKGQKGSGEEVVAKKKRYETWVETVDSGVERKLGGREAVITALERQ